MSLPSPEELARRVRALVDQVPVGASPYVAVGGDVAAGAVRGSRTPPWTIGFWLGQLHLAELVLEDPALRERLDVEQAEIGRLVLDRGPEFDHDIGFQMILGHLVDHRSGRVDHSAVLRAACAALAGRFNPVGRFLRAHGHDGSRGEHIPTPGDNDGPAGRFIADTWMNLPLLLWGSMAFDEPDWAQIALAHARTSREHLMTETGWVLHGFDIDPLTGEPVGPSTIQGASTTSPWSRAQAWVILGMPLVTDQLEHAGLLDDDAAAIWRSEARALREQFLTSSLPNGLAPWDFSLPEGAETLPDTSASAIVLDALAAEVDLSKDPPADTSGVIPEQIDRLCAALTPFTAPEHAGTGLLGGGAYHVRAGVGIDEPSAFGDYFLMEAAFRAAGHPVPYDLV